MRRCKRPRWRHTWGNWQESFPGIHTDAYPSGFQHRFCLGCGIEERRYVR